MQSKNAAQKQIETEYCISQFIFTAFVRKQNLQKLDCSEHVHIDVYVLYFVLT